MEHTLEDFLKIAERPLIAVIGATIPTKEYNATMGLDIGRAIRDNIDKHPGTIFTGGVEGVGVNVYHGVVNHSFYYATFGRPIPKTRFFVLVPNNELVEDEITGGFSNKKYEVPESYHELSKLARQELTIVRIGNNLKERRNYLAQIADVLVMINGSTGTLDEAILASKLSKKVFVLGNSGGLARTLVKCKEEKDYFEKLKKIVPGARVLSEVNWDYIHPVKDTDDLIKNLFGV